MAKYYDVISAEASSPLWNALSVEQLINAAEFVLEWAINEPIPNDELLLSLNTVINYDYDV